MSNASVAADDPRYDNMFQVEKESEALGIPPVEDPYSIWAKLRERAPVHRGSIGETMGLSPEAAGPMYVPGFNFYTAYSYEAVSDAFTRKNDFSVEYHIDMGVEKLFGETIFSMDGLRHRRYRDLIQAHFQPAHARGWWREKVIVELVDELVSAFAKETSVDLNSQLFAKLPMHTVTSGFGMSQNEGLIFRHHTQRLVDHSATDVEKADSMKQVVGVLDPLICARQAEPEDDIISALAQAQLTDDDGTKRRLTVEEITSFCRLIVFGGGGTTWRQLGITLFALLNHRDQLEAAIADRSLINDAVLESVRWETTDPLFQRKVVRDTTLHGVELPKGAVVHLCLGAANRDPTQWENPDTYDIHRTFKRSLAFGAGHHSCLGQHVARQEMNIAFDALFGRFPNIRWDPSKPPARILGGVFGRGPGPLHVLLK